MKLLGLTLAALIAATSSATIVQWDFPMTNTCHEGLAFADGITGALVWGGGDKINITLGRGDLWDHRGGYRWQPCQSYTNIVALIKGDKRDELLSLFKKETPVGEPRNPYMLPLGRLVVKLEGEALSHGTLDTATGIGTLVLASGKRIEIAMPKAHRCLALDFPAGVKRTVEVKHCMEFEYAKKSLEPLKFKPAVKREDGLDWELPADQSVSIDFADVGKLLAVSTRRGARQGTQPVEKAQKLGFAALREASERQWAAFWQEGARVRVPDAEIQEIFDYGMYRFGAMTDFEGIPAGLQGQWLEDDRLVPWNGDYHFNINVQECYSPAYRGGHFRNLRPLFDMVLKWKPILRENARKFANVDGYVLPHAVSDQGVCIGGFWTGTIDHGSTAWVADMMFRYVKYTGDIAFLREEAYDFMKGAMRVYRAMMTESEGRLSIPVGPSPEWGGADVKSAVGRDSSFQLAAAHRLARDLIAAAKLLGKTPNAMWLEVDQRLPAYSSGADGIELFAGQPLTESHRHHSHLAGLYPFDTIDLADQKMLENTYAIWVARGNGYWTGWCVPWAAILNIHLDHADAAANLLKDWKTFFNTDGHGSTHNSTKRGFTAFHGGYVMQMDGQCAAASAVMEMMAHEVNGETKFFRGCPKAWKDVSFENLALSDGRRVSGRRLNGKVTLEYSK